MHGRMFRWTSDGKGIAYIKREGRTENVFLQPFAGGASTPLTAFPEGSIANYEWSADGRLVLTHYLQMSGVVLLIRPRGDHR